MTSPILLTVALLGGGPEFLGLYAHFLSASAVPAPCTMEIVTPQTPAAMRYGGRLRARRFDEFRSALDQSLPLQGDGRLDRITDDLVELYAKCRRAPTEALPFLLQHHGVIEPAPRLISILTAGRTGREVARTVAESLEQSSEQQPTMRYGASFKPVPRGGVAVVLLQDHTVALRPVKKLFRLRDRVVLRGKIPDSYGHASLFRTRPDGRVVQAELVRDGRQFRVDFDCWDRGRNQLELTGVGRFGIAVLANFPVYCGVRPPEWAQIDLSERIEAQAEEELARTIFGLTNQERLKAELPTLRWSEEAARVAILHSADMRDAEFVGHVSPTTGGPADRVRANGIKVSLVLENVARAPSVKEAHAGLMNSPGHRANMMSQEATDLGVGVRRRENGELLVTQVFFRIPKRQDLERARQTLLGAIDSIRSRARRPRLRRDDALETAADRYAQALAVGNGQAAPLEAPVSVSDRYAKIVTSVEVVGSPTDFVGSSVQRRGRAGFGLGVAQGEHRELGANVLYVVVLIGVPRGPT